jgi:hypothetical protein
VSVQLRINYFYYTTERAEGVVALVSGVTVSTLNRCVLGVPAAGIAASCPHIVGLGSSGVRLQLALALPVGDGVPLWPITIPGRSVIVARPPAGELMRCIRMNYTEEMRNSMQKRRGGSTEITR